MDGIAESISPENLYGRVGCAAAPLIIDRRRAADVAAIRRPPDTMGMADHSVIDAQPMPPFPAPRPRVWRNRRRRGTLAPQIAVAS
ncbi:MAG TPA: hypothetical protein VGU20_25160 [Stellaceae bacterium]|nr:hypothetical protein [Stellaceae bacterium]